MIDARTEAEIEGAVRAMLARRATDIDQSELRSGGTPAAPASTPRAGAAGDARSEDELGGYGMADRSGDRPRRARVLAVAATVTVVAMAALAVAGLTADREGGGAEQTASAARADDPSGSPEAREPILDALAVDTPVSDRLGGIELHDLAPIWAPGRDAAAAASEPAGPKAVALAYVADRLGSIPSGLTGEVVTADPPSTDSPSTEVVRVRWERADGQGGEVILRAEGDTWVVVAALTDEVDLGRVTVEQGWPTGEVVTSWGDTWHLFVSKGDPLPSLGSTSPLDSTRSVLDYVDGLSRGEAGAWLSTDSGSRRTLPTAPHTADGFEARLWVVSQDPSQAWVEIGIG